ncbi:MAG: BolA family protein [bacterium]
MPHTHTQHVTAETPATIERKLREALAPTHFTIGDDSAKHRGHKTASGGGHYDIVVVSERFTGMSAIERQRLVYSILAEEMGSQIHALAMRTLTPAEWSARR